MVSTEPMSEFRSRWLPNMTEAGLNRLVELLSSASPYLIHGAFTKAVPMGCLASHVAWNHPATHHLSEDAGVCWLTKVAGLNPATSSVILNWDSHGIHDRELRAELIVACETELASRHAATEEAEPVAPLEPVLH